MDQQCNDVTCPSCGFRVISDTFEICEICGWEYDPVQSSCPDIMGANKVTLREAQRNFLRFGAVKESYRGMVRPPTPNDVKDPAWRPLDPDDQRS